MKSFFTKIAILSLLIMGTVTGINCIVDPANLIHESIISELVSELSKGNTVICSEDFNESQFNEEMLTVVDHTPDTIILGSSHIMYAEWEKIYDDYLILGLSGANLGDYYSLIGMLDHYGKLPNRMVIGVDTWAFLSDSSKGRHPELSNYSNTLNAKMQKTTIASESSTKQKSINTWKKTKELTSFPYFQSSVKRIISNPKSALRIEKNTVIVTDNSISDSDSKITPTCRRILSLNSYQTVNEMNMSADYQIDIHNIYSMGSGCSEIDSNHFKEFVNLIDYLQEHGTEVILYLPAWYPSFYDFFMTDSNYQFVGQLEDELRTYTSKSNVPLYGSYSPYTCNLSQNDYADCLHIKPEKVIETFDAY